MEREPGRLQLRLVLYPGEHVCEIEIEEGEEAVVGFATVCGPVDAEEGPLAEVPCHVYLELPLGERAVRDGNFGHVVPYRNIYAELEAEFGRAADAEGARDAG